MQNPIKRITQFNRDAGLLDNGYNDFLESSFQIEEALEGILTEEMYWLAPSVTGFTPKEFSRYLLKSMHEEGIPPLSDVDRLDKACDAVVYAVGSMAKLGLSPQQITQALNVVMDANVAKLNCPKDEYGKLTKPADFDEKYAPEPKLAAILSKRAK